MTYSSFMKCITNFAVWVAIVIVTALVFPANAVCAATVSEEIYNQGIAHYTNKNYRDAEFYLGQVLHDNAQNHSARYYLAASMAMQGKGAQAVPHLEYLLKVSPDNQSYKDLFNQVSKIAALSQGQSREIKNENAAAPRQGDAYMPGIQKTTVIGEGGYVPLIAAGAPKTAAPAMPAGYGELADKVVSPDPNIRRDAIRSLIDKKDEKLIGLLEWALNDRPCRELAARALINIGDKGIARLIAFADSSSDFNNRKFIFSVLGRIDNPAAEKKLLATWKTGETSLMPTFEDALINKGRRMIPKMIDALGNSERKVRVSAAQVLIRNGEASIDPVIELLNKGKKGQRVEAVTVLAGLPRDKVFEKLSREELKKLKEDEVPEIKAFAETMLPTEEEEAQGMGIID